MTTVRQAQDAAKFAAMFPTVPNPDAPLPSFTPHTDHRSEVAEFLADLADRLDPDVFPGAAVTLRAIRSEFDYCADVAAGVTLAAEAIEENMEDAAEQRTAANLAANGAPDPVSAMWHGRTCAYNDAAYILAVSTDVLCGYCGTFGHTFRTCEQTPTD